MAAEFQKHFQKIALIGANGMLARTVRRRAPKNYELSCYDLPDFDLTDRAQVAEVLLSACPDVIVNCAAYTAVDACEEREELATRVNAEGVGKLAAVARELDATLVHISTDYVFSGTKGTPYLETDPTGPISAYGRSKLKGEQAILASGLERYFILRTSWLYGPDGPNFVETILRLAADRECLQIVADQLGSPTYAGDLADAIFCLLQQTEIRSDKDGRALYGLYHFANEGQCSWYEFAQTIIDTARLSGIAVKAKQVMPITTEDYPLPAQRPAYSVLDKDKYKQVACRDIPKWRDSLKEYFASRTQL